MKFDIGDTVLLLHSGEEGVIVEELNNDMVKVNVNGTIFPVHIDQIDFPYFKRFTEKNFTKRKPPVVPGEFLPVEKQKPEKRPEKGVLISFLPEYDHSTSEPLVRLLKIYLVNETALTYLFDYRLLFNENLDVEVKNELLPFNHFYVQDITFESLNDRPKFEFNFSLQQPDDGKEPDYSFGFKLKAKQVIRKLQDMENGGEATFSYILFEKYPDKVRKNSDKWDIPSSVKKVEYFRQAVTSFRLPQYEVDLHIEKLTDHYKNLSPSDMLAIQLGEFQRQLDEAIAHHQFSIVIIHGVGKGTLRNEVHEILRHTPEVKSFVNQYDPRYGYGATEIFFEYSLD